ncbi:MAG: serine/threonine protein kinase [Rubripirellula sp.]|nr:protein kinase [Rhodopirellula sp.]MCH1438016.1 serine/threonine protein kinase [Rubripirellula sp.]OUX07905.1 MAG: protein kinase [Planctomycetaceae bacterium TMED240]
MPRSRLGPLAIEAKLGDHPSQSSVWRAVHVQLKRAVAVKVFAAPFGGTPEARAAFAAEWDLLKQIQHPAIVRCYGGGFEETDAYLAHELIEGPTLASELERRSRLSWESVLDLAEALTGALESLHDQEIVYGVLHPEKVLFAGLSPVLVDVRVNRASSLYLTNRAVTPDEMTFWSPELAENTNAYSVHSDLYSLGATLYKALTGRAVVSGHSVEEVRGNVFYETPESPASIVMDCPVWLDKLIMQMLEKDPKDRPHGAAAVTLALKEVRRRSMSRAGVAEHVSHGFSPLNVTDQKERDEARILLGHGALEVEDDESDVKPEWYDRAIVLVLGLILIASMITYAVWPLNETQMKSRAEELLTRDSRNALNQAKVRFLIPMLEKYPDGEHVAWVEEQLERVEMIQAEHVLKVKLKTNRPLSNEGERLYAEAYEFEKFGDVSTALDRYRSMETLLADDDTYKPFVNLARRQIASIEENGVEQGEAARIIQSKLDQAEESLQNGNSIAARKIWYSIVDLYGNNGNVAPLVSKAQKLIADNGIADNGIQEQEPTE